MKPIVFTPASTRQWVKLASDVRSRINRRLTDFATSGKGDVRRLRSREGSRLRIGDWRVIFKEDDGSIVVLAVGHRREIYD
jgi:mRNA interferase RelE/StbE